MFIINGIWTLGCWAFSAAPFALLALAMLRSFMRRRVDHASSMDAGTGDPVSPSGGMEGWLDVSIAGLMSLLISSSFTMIGAFLVIYAYWGYGLTGFVVCLAVLSLVAWMVVRSALSAASRD